jgi:hypothetical protein
MKFDKTLVMIFIPPLAAVILCVISPYLIREHKNYTPEQPEFLTYVDKLGLFTLKGDPDTSPKDIRDVFRREWILPVANPLGNPGGSAADPVNLTMIVEAGVDSYCIMNGREMHLGEKTDNFQITSIGSNQVCITYHNGTREIHHVKVY